MLALSFIFSAILLLYGPLTDYWVEQSCITSLTIRHLMRPFRNDRSLLNNAGPMGDILAELKQNMAELAYLRTLHAEDSVSPFS